MTYIDRLNAFHRQIVCNNLPPHAQLLYFHLLNINNQLGWQETFCITDRRLEYSTGLSAKSITDAKRVLANSGFIRIKTNKKKPRTGTIYTLTEIFLHSMEYKNGCKNGCKTEGKNGGKPSNVISFNNVINKKKEREEEEDARAREAPAAAISPEVLNAWRGIVGEPNFYERKTLSEWTSEFGAEKIVAALYKAAESNKEPRISIAFVRAILEGVERNAKRDESSGYDFKPYDWSGVIDEVIGGK